MKNVKVSTILAGLRAKAMDYTDFICALFAWKDEDNLNLMSVSDYVKFYTEDRDINIQWTDCEEIYKGCLGVDVMDEKSFVSASCDELEERMIVRLKNKENKVSAIILELA